MSTIRDLEDDEVYICHVGDCEYSFNIFGAVYNNLSKLLDALSKKFNHSIQDLEFYSCIGEDAYEIYFERNEIAYITIEELNPEIYPDDC